MLVVNRQFISLAPFLPSKLTGGLAGVGPGFPLAIYLFIGSENSATLAEEAESPRRNIPLAMFIGTLAIGLVYIPLSPTLRKSRFTITPQASPVRRFPFIDGLKASYAGLLIIAYIAGVTSIFSCLIGLTNSQAHSFLCRVRRLGAARLRPHQPHVHVFVAYAGLCGREGVAEYWVAPLLRVRMAKLARAGDGEALLIAEIDPARYLGSGLDPYLSDRCPDLYAALAGSPA